MRALQKRFRPMAAVCLLGIGLGLSACGSSSSSSSSTASKAAAASSPEVARIQGEVKTLEQRPTSLHITTPVGKPIPKGKTIDFLQCGVPTCATLAVNLKEAAPVLGWKVNVINQGLTPETVKAAWEQAARNKPDVVWTTAGFPKAIYQHQLEQLHAGGTVVLTHSDAQAPEPAMGYIGAINGAPRADVVGKAEADYLIAKSGGKHVHVLYVDASGFPILALSYKSFKPEFEKYCTEDCKIIYFDAPITSIGTTLGSQIAAQMQKNQDASEIALSTGDMFIGLNAALAGASIKRPPIVMFAQTPTYSKALASNELTAIWGQDGPESMWRGVDLLARHFAGQSIKPDVEADIYPQWWLTPQNIPHTEEDFPLVANYKEQFKKLWGLQ
jgi:ABC-type sugar transport system substrate-binding protein